MPYLSASQIERMKQTAKEDGMRLALTMEREHEGRKFVYSDDIKTLMRRIRKARRS